MVVSLGAKPAAKLQSVKVAPKRTSVLKPVQPPSLAVKKAMPAPGPAAIAESISGGCSTMMERAKANTEVLKMRLEVTKLNKDFEVLQKVCAGDMTRE